MSYSMCLAKYLPLSINYSPATAPSVPNSVKKKVHTCSGYLESPLQISTKFSHAVRFPLIFVIYGNLIVTLDFSANLGLFYFN